MTSFHRIRLFILIVCGMSAPGFGQTHAAGGDSRRLDSLKNVIKKPTDDTNKVKALNIRAWDYMNTGEYDSSLQFCSEARKISEGLKYQAGIAVALNSEGTVYRIKGDYPRALNCFFKVLKYYESKNAKTGIAGANANIGNIYNREGEFEKAVKYFT